MRTYKCHFRFYHPDLDLYKPRYRCVMAPDGIISLTDGFWVNGNLRLCDGVHNKYWIPPHCIDLLEIIEEEDDGDC